MVARQVLTLVVGVRAPVGVRIGFAVNTSVERHGLASSVGRINYADGALVAKRLRQHLVTVEIAGSSPVGSAKCTVLRSLTRARYLGRQA